MSKEPQKYRPLTRKYQRLGVRVAQKKAAGYDAVFFPCAPVQTSILVAEDDLFLSDMIVWELQEHGMQVARALDGEEAIAEIERRPPNLLLLDLLMPKKDGFAVLEHVRGRGYTFPILILSNLSDAEHVRQGREKGATDYLVKGAVEGDLWGAVKKYV